MVNTLIAKITADLEVLGEHPGDKPDRYWWTDGKRGHWLHEGEKLVAYEGKRYIICVREL